MEASEANQPRTLELLYVLLKLAGFGAHQKYVNVSTTELSRYLALSQQTTSRRMRALEKRGLLNRHITKQGQHVKITEEGLNELSRLYESLAELFRKPLPTVINGRVISGLGDGKYYMKIYKPYFKKKLGFNPFLGTLNLRVSTAEDMATLQKLSGLPAIHIRSFRNAGRVFGGVKCFRVKINGKIDGALIRPERTHHGSNMVEVIAPVNIREKLKLEDGDMVSAQVLL